MQLNPQQQKAVEHASGPVVIVAGPGTGKTKTLVARIQYLLRSGVAAKQVLALTFTKKAAEEMKVRLGESGVWIATFHALCHEILGGQQQFITESQRLQAIKGLSRPANLKHLSVRELGLLISRAKNMGESLDIVTAYNLQLAERGVIDFDDLLVKTKELLERDTGKRQTIQARFEHMLVDEFQDTNNLQYELLQLIRGTDNLFIIGDPLQSIYGFRGASGSVFDMFCTDFPQATTITLTTNYRSATAIVSLANAIFDGQLVAHSQKQGHAKAIEVLNEYSEAAWVVGEIQKAVGGDDLLRAVSTDTRDQNKGFADFAVLYRSRSAALATQRALGGSGLPFQIVGEGSPYEDVYVQGILNLLRACNGQGVVAVKGFTRLQAQVLVEAIDYSKPPVELAEALIEATGYAKNNALQSLISTLVRFKTLPEALEYFDTLATQQFYDPSADAITLLTIHAAKGLEFTHVFLIGAEEGILPHEKADAAEEKRLFYVAVTRAKESVDILHATKRKGINAKLSRFVHGLPAGAVQRIQDPNLSGDRRRALKRRAKKVQASLF